MYACVYTYIYIYICKYTHAYLRYDNNNNNSQLSTQNVVREIARENTRAYHHLGPSERGNSWVNKTTMQR